MNEDEYNINVLPCYLNIEIALNPVSSKSRVSKIMKKFNLILKNQFRNMNKIRTKQLGRSNSYAYKYNK